MRKWRPLFGTIGVVVTALLLAGLDGRRRRRELRRAQAEKISGWMIELPESEAYSDNKFFVQLILQNASDQLAYSLIASVVNANTEEYVDGVLGYRTYVGRPPPGRAEYKIEHPHYRRGEHDKNGFGDSQQDTNTRDIHWNR
jgi:hypothetical protein